MNTIAEIIHERVTVITSILKRREVVNRFTYTSSQWHRSFNHLYEGRTIEQLKRLLADNIH